ncbi:MAG: tRNA (uridine(34)/cytosine(34)/5-carboxymethylaminomethyluridine(34)-2'-O)-methyltransferase TrmL [Gammaproteobacteria bacterium]
MLNVVLVQPEIPPNTGNVIRLCANTGARLHLVEPLGFALDSARMRRAGLDYHEFTALQVHRSWNALLEVAARGRMFALTTGGERSPFDIRYERDDWLVFGCETRGLPDDVLSAFPFERRLRLPMRPRNRSLNLSNAVAVTVFEAWRQFGFEGAAPPAPRPKRAP